MIPVCRAATVRARDQAVIEQVGVPGRVLMELAGRAAADRIHHTHPHSRVALLCGPGNNGGDGFVVARWLALWGHEVRVWAPRSPTTTDSEANRMLLHGLCPEPGPLSEVLHHADVVVDALLGTGQRSAPRGMVRDGVEAILQARAGGVHVVALDLPTGVCADTGRAHGGPDTAVHAHETVTFGHWKPGLLCAPGAELAGRVKVVDIGLELAARSDPTHAHPDAWLLTEADILPLLPPPSPYIAKWDRGHVAVRAGGGAAVLACHGALASGAGLVTLLAPRSDWPIFHGLDPSVLLAEPEALNPRRHDALVIGPGLGLHHTKEVATAWQHAAMPVLADADALTILARHPTPAHANHPRVLTPHSAEAARLLGRTRAEVEADRFGAAQQLQGPATGVLKGPHSLITADVPRVMPFADPRLATAGSGDVLSGCIAAGLARGLGALDAATLGVWAHGASGSRMPACGTASHLVEAVRHTMAELSSRSWCSIPAQRGPSGTLGRPMAPHTE